MADAAQYTSTLKADEAFTLIFDDYQCESQGTDIVDFCMALGSVSHLCLNGVGKPERAAKVDRWQEIMEHLHALRPAPVAEKELDSHRTSSEQ